MELRLINKFFIFFALLFFNDALAEDHFCLECDTPIQTEAKIKLLQKFDKANDYFNDLFFSIRRKKIKNIKYEEIIGKKTEHSSTYPGSLYTQFKHLHRVIKSYCAYPKLRLEEQVINDIESLLDKNDKNSLYSILKKLSYYIPNEFDNRYEIQYLLGIRNEKPETLDIDKTLPQAINDLFQPIFNEWLKRVTFVSTDLDNIFLLTEELKSFVDNNILTEEQKLLIPEIGSLDDDKNTLYGMIISSQQVISSIINNKIPVSYSKLDHLLLHEDCSISASLSNTLKFLKGETVDKPTFTIKNRFDELQRILKMSLVERLLDLNDYWPNEKLLYSATNLLENTANKQSVIASIVMQNIDELRALYSKKDKNNIYKENSLLAKIVNITNLLMCPNYVVNDEDFELWNSLIGSVNDCNKNSILGILNYCKRNLDNYLLNDVFSENLDLIGVNSDLANIYKSENTLIGIINFLNRNVLSKTLLKIENFETVLSSIVQKANFDENLKSLIGSVLDSESQITFCGRFNFLKQNFRKLYDSNSFEWSSNIFLNSESLLDNLFNQLNSSLELSDEEFSEFFSEAWWKEDSIYGALNRIISTILSCGINNVLSNNLFQNSANNLKIQNSEYYLNLINNIIISDQESEIFKIIGPQDFDNKEKLLTINSRFSYLKEILNFSAPFLSFEEISAIYNLISNPVNGFNAKLLTIENLLRKNLVNDALSVVGDISSFPSMETLSGIINYLFYVCSNKLFSFILDPYKASSIGLNINSRYSILNDLRDLKEKMKKHYVNPNIEKYIGNDWDIKYSPTVFGRLASCEDILIKLWDNAFYIPIKNLMDLAAEFYKVKNEILQNESEDFFLSKIGTPVSNINEKTLFGILNRIIADSLTSQLGNNTKYISEIIPVIVNIVANHRAISQEDKIQILQLLIPNELIEEILQIDNLPEQNFKTLMEKQMIVGQSFYPIAGFIRFHQANQFLEMAKKITTIISDILEYLNETNNFDPVLQNKDPLVAQNIISKIGGVEDFDDVNFDTLFSLTNDLCIRLSNIYTRLERWMFDQDFSESFNSLLQIKNQFITGNCKLFYSSYCLKKISEYLFYIKENINNIVYDENFSEENTRVFIDEYDSYKISKEKIFSSITKLLKNIRESLNKAGLRLPFVLSSNSDNLFRSIDVSDYLIEVAENSKEIKIDVENVNKLLGYVPIMDGYQDLHNEGECDSISLYINEIANRINELTNTFEYFFNNFEQYKDIIFDISSASTYTSSCLIEINKIFNEIDKIYKNVFSHVDNMYELYCVNCDAQELSNSCERLLFSISNFRNLFYLADAILLDFSKISPFQYLNNILVKSYNPIDEENIIDIISELKNKILDIETGTKLITSRTIKIPGTVPGYVSLDPSIVSKIIES